MILSQSATAVGLGITSSFMASGGTAPYTFSVLPGGIGGLINASSGIYTAPTSEYGEDTIQAVDSLGAKARARIFVTNALGLFCDVIRNFMEVETDQVYLWSEKFTIPKDSRIYMPIGIVSMKPFGSTNRFNSVTNEADQSVNMLARLDVNILSRGPEALNRKEEIVLAMNSTYAQKQQLANSFYIAPLTSAFVNLSEVDGAAIPYRFVISTTIQYAYRKSKSTQYFDDFAAVAVTNEP